jgi:predicted phosphodiesterase
MTGEEIKVSEWINGSQKLSKKEFRDIALTIDINNYRTNIDYIKAIVDAIKEQYGFEYSLSGVRKRVKRCQNKGDLPMLTGNYVPDGTLKGTSTLYDEEGKVKLQWVKTDKDKEDTLEEFRQAMKDIAKNFEGMFEPREFIKIDTEELLPVYISNDVHFGALMWGEETKDRNWNLKIALETFKSAVDYLVDRMPYTEQAIVVDLGDLLEMDDMTNMTPKSGNVLDTDGRFPRVTRVATEAMIYFINRALDKSKKVYFYDVNGNHDMNAGYGISQSLYYAFLNEPRVIVDEDISNIKYHQFGKTLLGFAHGDGLKPKDASETMVMHNEKNWSDTKERFFHFGHTHKDSVIDTKLCRIESHRNIAPLNAWASNNGFGRNAGTMKGIIYDSEFGEDTRIIYNVRRNGINV